MSRAESILRAVSEELRRHAPELEAALEAPETISLIVKLKPDGTPYSVIYRTESRSVLKRAG